MIKKRQSTLQIVIMYILLVVFCLIALAPIYFVVVFALSPGTNLSLATLIPQKVTMSHFHQLLTQTPVYHVINLFGYKMLFTFPQYIQWYLNTLFIACVTCILSVIFTTMTAYVFSRYRFQGKKLTIKVILILQMFPQMLALVAIYVIMVRLNLINSLWSLIIIYVAGGIPFNAFLVKGYFDAIPYSMDEAARIDGAGHLKIFVSILLPVTKPILVFLALITFTGPWMDFIFPSLLLTDPNKWTVAMGIFQWIGPMNIQANGPLFACGGILVAIPITVLFVVGQKYLVAGLTAGSSK